MPRNRELMRIYRDLRFVEQLDSGIHRILKVYDKSIFKISDNFLEISFPFEEEYKGSGQVGGVIGGAIGSVIGGEVEELTERQREILDIITKNNKISYKAISEILNINESAVTKHISNLKNKKIIERIGGTRGYWKVLLKNNS